MTWRAVFAFVLVVMIAASIGMAVAAVERSPGWIVHPGAPLILREVWLALVVYAGLIVVVVAHRGEDWDSEMQSAALFGSIAGVFQALNMAMEGRISDSASTPILQIALMVVVFALWAIAGARTSKGLQHFGPGLVAAVMSSGVCMVVAVTVGFAIDLFISPPLPSVIELWPEFQQSAWMDARAFGIGNTLEKGFTHLWMGPGIAMVVGALGAGIGTAIGIRERDREPDSGT